MRLIFATLMAGFLFGGTALADEIEGNWRTDRGPIAAITPCGPAFCITMRSGKFKGKAIGRMEASTKGAYAGEITDPESDKTYSGKASINGDALAMKGCVFGGLICKTQNWKRQ